MAYKKSYLIGASSSLVILFSLIGLAYHYYTNLDTTSITYLFAHGMGSSGREIQQFSPLFTVANEKNILTECDALETCVGTRAVSFDFPDSLGTYDAEKVSLGQETDINSLEEIYHKALNHEKNGIVLTGVSRGAATILNFVGTRQPKNIKALVVESPFDSIANVIKYQLSFWGIDKIPFSESIIHKLVEFRFGSYCKNGICPLQAVTTIAHDIPILLIHSKTDELISVNSSRTLYKTLLESGHTNVYYLEFEQGNHASLMYDNNQEIYRNVVHAFYKKHNLPYIESYAQAGSERLATCKPSLEEITTPLKKEHWIA